MLHVDVARRLHAGKVTAHGHHAQMLDRELHLRVHRVELPGAHERPPVTTSLVSRGRWRTPQARLRRRYRTLDFSYLLVWQEPCGRASQGASAIRRGKTAQPGAPTG